MILLSPVWYDIVPREYDAGPIAGKWLFFADKQTIHSWLPQLDELVEKRVLRAAKVSRKDPQRDPFPHKPCVLCAFTSDADSEKQKVKDLLFSQFGIEVSLWKSDAQTNEDWEEDGWLKIEAEITALKRIFPDAEMSGKPSAALRRDLLAMLERLEGSIQALKDPNRIAEIQLSLTNRFVSDLRIQLSQRDITLKVILDQLDKIQVQLAHVSEQKDRTAGVRYTEHRVRDNYLFVVMPFAETHIDTYDTIRRAVLKVRPEIVVERVDEKPGAVPITDEIQRSISMARVVVCDLSDERPNVYYELGYAHGLRRDVICVARNGTKIHFDVAGLKILFFETYRALETALSEELQRLLTSRSP